jgi:hypothetical protein
MVGTQRCENDENDPESRLAEPAGVPHSPPAGSRTGPLFLALELVVDARPRLVLVTARAVGLGRGVALGARLLGNVGRPLGAGPWLGPGMGVSVWAPALENVVAHAAPPAPTTGMTTIAANSAFCLSFIFCSLGRLGRHGDGRRHLARTGV